MAWQKSSPELAELFLGALPDDPAVERRKMFGYPCAFVNGNMFAGLHEQNVVLRLGEAERAEAQRAIGARPFVPMGRPMREYVAIDGSTGLEARRLKPWLARAFAYGRTLPAKQKKEKKPQAPKAPAATKKSPPSRRA